MCTVHRYTTVDSVYLMGGGYVCIPTEGIFF